MKQSRGFAVLLVDADRNSTIPPSLSAPILPGLDWAINRSLVLALLKLFEKS
jgi:hypothetical protein